MANPSATPTTAEELLDLAASVFDERFQAAPVFHGQEPPSDGDWKIQNFSQVDALIIKKGASLVEIIRYDRNPELELAVWEFSNTDPGETLTVKRFRNGALHAFTNWGPADSPASIPASSFTRVGELIAP